MVNSFKNPKEFLDSTYSILSQMGIKDETIRQNLKSDFPQVYAFLYEVDKKTAETEITVTAEEFAGAFIIGYLAGIRVAIEGDGLI